MGPREIRWVYLFEAYYNAVAWGLVQADGKMNQLVGEKNRLDMSGKGNG